MRNTAGVCSQQCDFFGLAERNLSIFAPQHHGLDVAALCQLLRAYADQIVASDYKTNPWSPETAPKLVIRLQRNGCGTARSASSFRKN